MTNIRFCMTVSLLSSMSLSIGFVLQILYSDKYIGGYFDDKGELVVCEEYGLTDADVDRYAVQVQNGDGYYDEYGIYRSYRNYEKE